VLLALVGSTALRAAETAPEPAAATIAQVEQLKSDGKRAEAAAQLEGAIKTWKAIADKDEKNADASYQLARLYLKDLRTVEAEAAIDQAIAHDGTKPEYYKLRTQLFIWGNRGEDAAAALEKVVELDPQDIEYIKYLIGLYSHLKQDAKAEAMLERVLKVKPEETELPLYMASVYRERYNGTAAMKWIDRTAAIDPDAPNLDMSRGLTLELLGRNAEVYELWKRFAADPKNADRAEIYTQKMLVGAAGLGEEAEVETLRAKLLAMHKEGKTTSPFFERERFTHGKATVLVEEYYALTGPQALRYMFRVALDGKPAYGVALGSYDLTNQNARQNGTIKTDERLFHLDWYGPEYDHGTFGMFGSEPKYSDMRLAVGEIIDGKRQPQSVKKLPGAYGCRIQAFPDAKPREASATKPEAPVAPKPDALKKSTKLYNRTARSRPLRRC
jgi:tetratricopeptide (TPR) repeat protein